MCKVTKILLGQDHAHKGKESFHVKTKDSTFLVSCSTELENDEQMAVWPISVCNLTVYFIYFEGLSGYRNTCRVRVHV